LFHYLTFKEAEIMRVVILGAGFAGYSLVKKLSFNENISKIVVIDKNEARLKKVRKLGDKISTYKIDAVKVEKLSSYISRSDLTISLLPPNKASVDIIKVCIDEGSNYMDLGISDYNLLFTINHDSIFKDSGLLALPSYGADPGLTNVIAKYLSEKMKTVTQVSIRDGSVTFDDEGNYYVYSPKIFAQEIIEKPLIYYKGKYVRLSINEAIKKFEFPEGIGLKSVWLVSHEEVITLPRYLGKEIESLDFGYYVPEILEKELNLLIMEDGSFNLKGAKPLSKANDKKIDGYELLVIDVLGKIKEDIKLRGYAFLKHKDSIAKFNENATAFMITFLPVEIINMVAKRQINHTGVLLPEMLDPNPIISKLKDLGLYKEISIPLENVLSQQS